MIQYNINHALLISDLEKLGKNIIKYRKRIGLSQENLAYEIGMSRKGLSEIENGRSNPEYKTLFAIANALNITISELTTYN